MRLPVVSLALTLTLKQELFSKVVSLMAGVIPLTLSLADATGFKEELAGASSSSIPKGIRVLIVGPLSVYRRGAFVPMVSAGPKVSPRFRYCPP